MATVLWVFLELICLSLCCHISDHSRCYMMGMQWQKAIDAAFKLWNLITVTLNYVR